MKFKLICHSAVLWLFVLTGQAVAQSGVTATAGSVKSGAATISGKVMMGDQPAAEILVGLIPGDRIGGQRNIIARAKTDASGQFRLERIVAGRYRLTPLAPGYVLDDANPFEQGKSLTVGDGENISNADFKIERGGVITGKVTGPNGRPLIQEFVQLQRLDERGQRQEVQIMDFLMQQTDDRGIYRIYGLESGRYVISAGSRTVGTNRINKRTWHPDVTEEAQAKVIEVSAGSVAEDVDIKIAEAAETYSIAGRVIDVDTGRPLTGFLMMVGRIRETAGPISFTGGMEATNANGEFLVQGLTPGRYSVMTRSSMGMIRGGSDASSEYYGDPVEVEVISSDVTNVEFKMQRGMTLSGSIALEGSTDPELLTKLRQTVVNVQPSEPGRQRMAFSPATAIVDGNLNFRAVGLRPGKHRLSFYSMRGGNLFTLLRIERDGVPTNGEIEINAGETNSNVRLVVGYGNATIRGVVRVVGELPPGFRIMVWARAKNAAVVYQFNRGGEVGVNGRYQIDNLMAGEYEISARAFPSRPGLSMPGRPVEGKQIVTISAGQASDVPPIVIDLTKPPEDPNKPKENNQ